MNIRSMRRGERVGERSMQFKKKSYDHARSILEMHSNETGRVCPCTLIDIKRKRYVNAVDVVERLHDPTDPSTERTTPSCSAHVHLDEVPRALDPVEGPRRVRSARRCGDGNGDVIRAGLRLSTTML